MDEQVVRRDQTIRDLSDQFINVRLVKCNSLDLGLFQIDWDLTFGVVFLNADRTVYARYGTRDSMEADNDVALEGLAATMREVLDLHRNYPSNRESLVGKQPVPVEFQFPEQYDALDHFQSSLDYEGQVAKSCIHCHQVRDAARRQYRDHRESIPLDLLYAFPSAKVLGLQLDTRTVATITGVAEGSPGASGGLMEGDQILAFDGSSIASEADLRWMLHRTPAEPTMIELTVRRPDSDSVVACQISLPQNWRSSMDLSWRPTTWDLRRMATGGMTLEAVTGEQREALGLEPDQMALRAVHVGMYGQHARAKRAGMQVDDIIISFDGRTDLMTENALLEYVVREKQAGNAVSLEYLRSGQRNETRFKLQ